MKRVIFILTLVCIAQVVKSQNHEVGLFMGGSNFIGDVGSTTYINPNSMAYGVVYKWNVHPRYSWRFSAIMAKVSANDKDSSNPARKSRGYSFDNQLLEVAAGFEFNFFDFDLRQRGYVATPYLLTGVNYFNSTDYYVINKKYMSNKASGTIAIPIVAGYKIKVTDKFVLGAEVGARYTFSDDIDGSTPKNKSLKYLRFGNVNSNDWYVFTGLTLTYTFGQKPCYCIND